MRTILFHSFSSFLAHEKMVDLLLQNGANINAKNKNGHTPLHLSIRNGKNEARYQISNPFRDLLVHSIIHYSQKRQREKGKNLKFENYSLIFR